MEVRLIFVLAGLAERVQKFADFLDQASRDLMTWRRSVEPARNCGLSQDARISRAALIFLQPPHQVNPAQVSGKAFTLSPAVERVSSQPGRFCVSLRQGLSS